MNAEIYFPREGKSFGQTSGKEFEETIKKLNEIDVNIIYKTEVNLNERSITDALAVTESGDERIGMVIIADVLEEDSEEKAKNFMEGIGIVGKIKRVEAAPVDIKEQEQGTDHQDVKSKKKNKKAKKNEVIDISNAVVTFEQEQCFAYYVEYNNKLIVLLPRPECLDTTFDVLLYTTVSKIVVPEKKDSFWKRFIPCAGDRPLDVVRKIVLILAICTFVISSYMLINILVVQPAINDNTTNNIRDLFVSTPEGETTPDGKSVKKSTDGSDGTLADFSKLLAANPDTVGWITVPNTSIDHVVVKPSEDKDHEYYLYRDFYGNPSNYGTIFMDYRSSMDSKNLILHGHHMQDGRMFANLKSFEDFDFYQSTPTFTFNTIYEKSKWKIISVFKTNTLEYQGEFFNYLRGDFESDYDFLNFVYQIRLRSLFDCPVDVNEHDTLVTLSTCTYDFQDFRFVVVARKVRDGESADVDISKAKKNSNVLYPDVWYNTYGGTPPKVSSFQDAFNNGELTWYDGKKTDWSKEDDESLTKELNKGKQNANKMLKDYVDKVNYNETEMLQANEILSEYKKLINDAKDGTEVNRLYDEAMKKIQKLKTTEELASEAEESSKRAESEAKEASKRELQSAKESAVVEMTNSIAGNVYRLTQADLVNKTIDTYTEQINAAKTVDNVEKIKKDGITKLKAIKTDDEMRKEESSKAAEESSKAEASRRAEESRRAAEESSKAEVSRRAEESRKAAEELRNAKTNAVAKLNGYNPANYDNSDEIKDIISYYTNQINAAADIDRVNSLISGAQSEIERRGVPKTESSEEISDDEP